ncbi:MAG TPA: hypothetical protein VH594_11440 [Trebonia sp.]
MIAAPVGSPASLFWPVTRYDAQTRSEVATGQEKAVFRSLFADIAPDGANSVDRYFGPAKPDGAGDR